VDPAHWGDALLVIATGSLAETLRVVVERQAKQAPATKTVLGSRVKPWVGSQASIAPSVINAMPVAILASKCS
jgi:hypothetical protein